MPYTTEIAGALASTLRTFLSVNRHQFAGNAANVDFWIGETEHCLAVIDGYRARFEAIKYAQADYIARHDTVTIGHGEEGYRSIAPVKGNLSDQDRKQARKDVVDLAYGFVIRAFKERHIAESQLREFVARIGTSIDPADLK
jgi:hypothetical protein